MRIITTSKYLCLLTILVLTDSAFSEDSTEFLSSTDPAYAHIEKIQLAVDPTCERRAEYETSNVLLVAQQIAQKNCSNSSTFQCTEDDIASMILEATQLNLPTRCESYAAFTLISYLLEEVTNAYKPRDKIQFPKFGTLLQHSYNASVTTIPNSNEYVILFNSTFFNYTNEFVKAILTYANMKDSDEDRMNSVQSIIYNTAYVATNGEIPRANNLNFSNLDLATLTVIRDSIELFVMSHEYAHIELAHTGGNASPFIEGTNITVLNRNQQQELDADVKGSEILEIVLQANNPELLRLHGDLLFLTMLEIFEEALRIAGTATSGSTHPPASVRYQNLLKIKNSKVDKSDIGYQFQVAARELWDMAKPSYTDLFR